MTKKIIDCCNQDPTTNKDVCREVKLIGDTEIYLDHNGSYFAESNMTGAFSTIDCTLTIEFADE